MGLLGDTYSYQWLQLRQAAMTGGEELARKRAQEQDLERKIMEAIAPYGTSWPSSYTNHAPPIKSAGETLILIKKSIKQINAETVNAKAQGRIEDKILRLLELGANAQAAILEVELRVRQKLNHLKEWDYKVLSFDEIKKYEQSQRNWDGQGGRAVIHIDSLDKYAGNTTIEGESKDKIIPDNVLDELEIAKERQLFDSFAVLWAEKVKDPLLLGQIDGCKDYFLIAEWGEDIRFDDLVEEK